MRYIHNFCVPGGYDPDGQKSRSNYNFYDTILQYDPDSDIWEVVGHMMEAKTSHAITVMDSGDFSDFCDITTTTPNSNTGAILLFYAMHT